MDGVEIWLRYKRHNFVTETTSQFPIMMRAKKMAWKKWIWKLALWRHQKSQLRLILVIDFVSNLSCSWIYLACFSFQSTWTNFVTVYRWQRQSIHHLPQVPHPTGSAIQTRLYLGFHRLPQVHKNLGHILPNAMVTSNKNVHNFWHHFLAQFFMPLHTPAQPQ